MFFGSRQGSWRIWLVIGLGLCLYGYYEWSQIEIPSQEALDQAIETQYQAEIARLQQQAGDAPVEISPEWREKFLSAIRHERTAPVANAKKRVQSIVGLGLLLVVMAAGMFVMGYLGGKPKP